MKFSVITISFNAEKLIEKTIKSILEQNFTDYEYLFIDGNSKDNTNQVIESYRSAFEEKGVSFIHVSEPDKGISDAFSKGVNRAVGEIVIILNAGDEMLPGVMRYLAGHFPKKADVYYGNILMFDEEKKTEYVRKSKGVKHLSELKYTMIALHPATYIRKSAYEKYGVYDLSFKYAMDTELLLRMYMGGARFKYVDKEFTRFMAGGTSDKNLIPVLKENMRIARSAGEPELKIRLKMIEKYLHHYAAKTARAVLNGIKKLKKR